MGQANDKKEALGGALEEARVVNFLRRARRYQKAGAVFNLPCTVRA